MKNKNSPYGKCPLCDKKAVLKESHIISKFIYKPVKEKTGKMTEIDNSPFLNGKTRQDGIKEYLLCGICEERRQKYEDYVSKLIRKNTLIKNGDIYHVTGIDYVKFKLFLLFNLFMFAASKSPEFEEINIPSYYDDLKDMILNNDPGTYAEFGCIISVLEDDLPVQHKIFQDLNDYKRIVVFPRLNRQGSEITIVTLFGGIKWHYLLTHSPLSNEITANFLKENGELIIQKSSIIKNLKNLGLIDVIVNKK